MTHARLIILALLLSSLPACALYETKQGPANQPAQPKELAVPVGKNWKVTEEAPALTNERNARPAFQTEQSVQPEGVQRPAAPTDEKGRKIETTR